MPFSDGRLQVIYLSLENFSALSLPPGFRHCLQYSSRGRQRLSCRPVRGSWTLRVRFQIAGPKMARPSIVNGRNVPQAGKEEIILQLYKYTTADGRKAAD